MLGAQTLGGGSQTLMPMEPQVPLSGISLANVESQLRFWGKDQPWALQAFFSMSERIPTSEFSGSRRLLRLKRRTFTEENRSQRIARSLAAVSAPQPTQLSASEWKRVVEADVEDQY
jgi:hypothetical protein